MGRYPIKPGRHQGDTTGVAVLVVPPACLGRESVAIHYVRQGSTSLLAEDKTAVLSYKQKRFRI